MIGNESDYGLRICSECGFQAFDVSGIRIRDFGQLGVTSTVRYRDLLESRVYADPDRLKPGFQRKVRRKHLTPPVGRQ